MRHIIIRVIQTSLLSLFIIGSATADVVLVVNAKLGIDAITEEQATKIFLGKTTTLPDGTKIEPVDQAEGNAARDEFYAKVVKKTASQLNAYWSRLIFTGKGQPPKAVEDDDEVLELVGDDASFVGYIDSGSVDETVKVVLTAQ